MFICERATRTLWESPKEGKSGGKGNGDKSILQIYCATEVTAFSVTAGGAVRCFPRTKVDLGMQLENGGNKGLLGTGKSGPSGLNSGAQIRIS